MYATGYQNTNSQKIYFFILMMDQFYLCEYSTKKCALSLLAPIYFNVKKNLYISS